MKNLALLLSLISLYGLIQLKAKLDKRNMKTIILFFFLFVPGLFCQGQTWIKKTVYRPGGFSGELLTACYGYEGTRPADTVIIYQAVDDRYRSLREPVELFSGSASDFFNFMTEVKEFTKVADKNKAFIELSGHRVEMAPFLGSWKVVIWDLDGLLYHCFTPDQIDKAFNKFVAYAEMNSYIYK